MTLTVLITRDNDELYEAMPKSVSVSLLEERLTDSAELQ